MGNGDHRLFQVSQSGILLLNKLILKGCNNGRRGWGNICFWYKHTTRQINNFFGQYGSRVWCSYLCHKHASNYANTRHSCQQYGRGIVSGSRENNSHVTRNVVYSNNNAKNASYKMCFARKIYISYYVHRFMIRRWHLTHRTQVAMDHPA